MTRYVVIGGGAVGATVAAQLHLAGTSSVLVARGAHLAALRENGLRYVRPEGTTTVPVPVVGGPDEVDLTDDDPDWSPAWVDLVRTESSPRIPVQVDRHDRHSRPFRPARSSTHANNRPVEPVDRTSVLPR